jgi:hypothetical protein
MHNNEVTWLFADYDWTIVSAKLAARICSPVLRLYHANVVSKVTQELEDAVPVRRWCAVISAQVRALRQRLV